MQNIFGWIRENPDITKQQKVILYVTFGLVPAWMVGMLIWFLIFPTNPQEDFLKRMAKERFNGKVGSLYFNSRNHNVKTALLSDKYKFELFPEWEGSVSIGDSVIKNDTTPIVRVLKAGGKIITLDYKMVTNNWK